MGQDVLHVRLFGSAAVDHGHFVLTSMVALLMRPVELLDQVS